MSEAAKLPICVRIVLAALLTKMSNAFLKYALSASAMMDGVLALLRSATTAWMVGMLFAFGSSLYEEPMSSAMARIRCND